MKKLSVYTPLIREAEEKALSDLQKNWRDYFGAKLAKYGAKSPADLDDAKKKEFFNDLKTDWDKGKGATEAGEKDIEKHGVKESAKMYEAKSIEKVHDEWGKVTKEMAELAKVWKTATGAEKDKVLNTLKALTAKKKELEKELNKLIANKDRDLELVIDEAEFLYGLFLNEAKIKTEEEFKEYAQNLLKKAHKNDYDENKAEKTIDGILKKAKGDLGAAVGILTAGLG